ncbi:hypothetical protein DSO57_1013047 [Entomophthora muscae]|uniref:Uncharacterized protein n=1 Tax=Entomophthora muscae TaxID=34485 RepID=A0ACC2RWZ4_9FUNG|nr:hypothetical protein DSO57_1013047 [Entomophthora muscae]
MLSPGAEHNKIVLTTWAASPLVTPFPRTFSGPSPFVSEVPKQPKVSSTPLEKDITNAPSTPMVLVLSPGPSWAPFQIFYLDYKQACAAARSLLHSGTVVSKLQAQPTIKVQNK